MRKSLFTNIGGFELKPVEYFVLGTIIGSIAASAYAGAKAAAACRKFTKELENACPDA